MSVDWNPSPAFLATSAHIGWAVALVLAGLHRGIHPALIAGLFIGFALLKEFWADLTWLEHDTVAGSTLDFVAYTVGLGLGNLCWFVSFWLALTLTIILLVAMAVADVLGLFSCIKT